jgi:Methyltransferase domain
VSSTTSGRVPGAVRSVLALPRVRAARRRLERVPAQLRGVLLHRGTARNCPCCRASFAELAPFNGPDRVCWRCGSLERDRLLWLWFDREPDLLGGRPRLLHIAPEPALSPRLRAAASEYVSGDLGGEFGQLMLDVTKLPFADGAFDGLVCNHVLEHVPDDHAAMRELRRVLAPGGWAVLLVPDVEAAVTDEDPAVTAPEARLARFGQADHVRRYGRDYLDRLAAAGFAPAEIDLAGTLPEAEIERHRLRKFGRIEPIFLGRVPA